MDYGRSIKMLRASRKLTQKQLAERIGADASFVSLLEGNRRSPSTETLEGIARELHVPMYLLVLLASDTNELGSVPVDGAKLLGKELLSLLTSTEAPKRRARRVRT